MTLGSHIVDNHWIVGSNLYLLLKYDYHINVEICAIVKSFKYLYKYISKRHDVALIQVRRIAFGKFKWFSDYADGPE